MPFIERLSPLLFFNFFFFFFCFGKYLGLFTSTVGDLRYRIFCWVAKERTFDPTVNHDLGPRRLGEFLKTP